MPSRTLGRMTSMTDAPSARRVALGRYGERVAGRRLVDQGMVVLDRNWRCDAGEIDLVLRDGDVLVVCEVKTRVSDVCGTPHEAVTAKKLERLKRLAVLWAEAHDVHPTEVRIDLVAIHHQPRGAALVEHVPGLV
jgi:putative endonuclease